MNKHFLRAAAVVVLAVAVGGGYSQTATGTFTDTRDNKRYRTVTIGKQTWMAENLNYQTDSSWCYNNDSSMCDKYGRLYGWDAALSACANLGGGWRLPTNSDWWDLLDAIGGKEVANEQLKAASGWKNRRDGSSGNGTDAYGFSALPGGYRHGSRFHQVGDCGGWWMDFMSGMGIAYFQLCTYDFEVIQNWNDWRGGFSVRCVRN